MLFIFFFFFQAEDGIRDLSVTGVQTCALPIYRKSTRLNSSHKQRHTRSDRDWSSDVCSSDEHTSELQSRSDLVCRLLLAKNEKLVRVRRAPIGQTTSSSNRGAGSAR